MPPARRTGEKHTDAERKKISARILSKIQKKGVASVLSDTQDLLSVLLLATDDPAYVAVRKAALEEKRQKDQREEQTRARASQSQSMEMRPVHVAIGKGATQVYWKEVPKKK